MPANSDFNVDISSPLCTQSVLLCMFIKKDKYLVNFYYFPSFKSFQTAFRHLFYKKEKNSSKVPVIDIFHLYAT